MKRLLFLAGAALFMAACAESPTSPSRGLTAGRANHDDDFKCASGYIVAYDEDGNPYCAPEGDGARAAAGTGPASIGTAGPVSTSGRP